MQQPEAWLRGPIEGVPPYLMPAAHAIVQALEEVEEAASSLTDEQLWLRPGGVAPIGFHIRHIGGVLDRLFTYAQGEALTDEQFAALRAEQEPGDPPPTLAELLTGLRTAVDRAIEQIRDTESETLLEPRGVGRKQLPSDVLGLIFHAAGHAQRHTGQLIATAGVVRNS